MSEPQNDRKIFSLSEVMASIQRTLLQRYNSSFWVKAEMNKLNHYSYSGHAYPDLVEKKNNKVVAQARGILWKTDFDSINARFIQILQEPLKDGITILFCARITFDATYGLSLRILDIDPVYTLGDLEREKQLTLQRLRELELLMANKTLPLPLPFPKRLAIISVETSKGYADFCKILDNNAPRYTFFRMLFPSILQGDRAVEGIITQLERIKKVKTHFDMVVIVRGGGGDIGLSCYNNFDLSLAIASFPLPILTGIGHSTNETVAEMVAFQNAITPTELADIILSYARKFEDNLQIMQQQMLSHIRFMHDLQMQQLRNLASYLVSFSEKTIRFSEKNLLFSYEALCKQKAFFFRTCASELEHLRTFIDWNAPQRILHRGFTISHINGVIARDAQAISVGETMETLTDKYKITSTIETIIPVKTNE